MRAAAVLTAALTAALGLSSALTACATPVTSSPGGPDQATNQNDCAVIAAVAKGHYRFNTTDNVPPPVWLFSEGGNWSPRCDWSRYGVSFPKTYDLIDASAYIFRAYHALPPLTRKSDGTPVGAVQGYCNMLWKLLQDMKGADGPTHLAAIFDHSEKTFRNDLYDQYKANRRRRPRT
jgi:hypothetical protein